MNLPVNINEREKKVLIAGGLIIILILLFELFSWYGETRKEVAGLSDTKSQIIQKQLSRLADKENLTKDAKRARGDLQRQEQMLLKSSKPPVAAAELQRTLKQSASSLRIDIKLERALNPIDTGPYLAIPVEIGFTTSTGKLKDMLMKLRDLPVMITVTEMKVRVNNVNKPKDIYATLIVTGFIKKAPEGGKENKQANNVT